MRIATIFSEEGTLKRLEELKSMDREELGGLNLELLNMDRELSLDERFDLEATAALLEERESEIQLRENIVTGEFEVVSTGSVIVGCMSWETPYLKLRHIETGREFRWVSEKIEELGLYNTSLKRIFLRAYYRNSGMAQNLYKVKIKKA